MKKEKIKKQKKLNQKKLEEPILKLEEEEPLILDQVHEEKKFKKKKIKFLQLQEKWLMKQKMKFRNRRGNRKKWFNFKRRYNELDGFQTISFRKKN